MTRDPKSRDPQSRGRREWRPWHVFAIAAAAVAIIGGVWGLVSPGAPAPQPSPTGTMIIDETP